MNDVAKKANVSRATAARILGGYAGPRSKSRESVLEAAKDLGYFPNKLAKSLASNKSDRIGVVLPDIENLFFAKVYRGIESVLYERGFTVVLGISGEDSKRENELVNNLLSEQVEGIIIAPSNGLRDFHHAHVPLISVDRIPADEAYRWVSTDNYESSSAAVDHIVSQGYRNIAFIANLPNLSTIVERCQGIKDTTTRLGVHLSTLFTQSFQLDYIVSEIEDFLKSNQPDAIIVADSVLCTAVLIVARELNIHIGTELGLISFDDEPWMSLVSPTITTVKQPVVEMGVQSANLLLDQIKSDGSEQQNNMRLTSELIIRESTRF